MGNREILRTDNALVRVMELSKDDATAWHHHSEVADFFVCLSGAVQIETKAPDGTYLLHPGQTAQVSPPQAHRVVNHHGDTSQYLLVQGVGRYDFIEEG
jgi:quercetin dioxygenase-like cupin family protein